MGRLREIEGGLFLVFFLMKMLPFNTALIGFMLYVLVKLLTTVELLCMLLLRNKHYLTILNHPQSTKNQDDTQRSKKY